MQVGQACHCSGTRFHQERETPQAAGRAQRELSVPRSMLMGRASDSLADLRAALCDE